METNDDYDEFEEIYADELEDMYSNQIERFDDVDGKNFLTYEVSRTRTC